GFEPARIHGTIHYGDEWPGNTSSSDSYVLPGNDPTAFHVYAVEWEEGVIRWYVDDVLYATQTSWWSTSGAYPAPFDVDFHLLLNLAVGGEWPGPPDGSTAFPQNYVIDYVRVYELPANRVFDDIEHADPFNHDWFVFNDYGVGNGTLFANGTDLPPENGGNASLQTDWSSGGTAGYFGGFGRSRLLSIPDDVSEFHFWINPDQGQNFTLAVNLQEDDNSDGAPDEEFQYDCTVSNSTSACAVSGGGWQLVRIPLTDFYKDTSFLTGGNGTFDPASGGNGALTHVVMAIFSNSGADASFRTDYWAFQPEPADFDNDGIPDVTDADDDDDGIGDVFDDKPLEPDNACNGEAAAVFSQQVDGAVTCAASASITAKSIAGVLATGNLRLIAPAVDLETGFIVTGSLTVISADPCPGCATQ
ncbi:MAG: glycoside hydrolase family 16 protein, partial [Gammaproteobacteria bacterium]|nr:glycoside hydrolase family 16 protein [Gammaproteobacteria bacterium]NNL51124.1 glycoside hydrolase family 16 protein [Woeseiaceae bacterium]